MLTERILFWPGMGKPHNVMRNFLDRLSAEHEVRVFPFEYDAGEMPFLRESEWCRWLKAENFAWWCGLSLGASLACVMASFCPPERLTLINPFSSRRILARERGFSLAGQWDFSPSEYAVEVITAEAVLSVHDEKIPLWHGIHLLNKICAKSKRAIFVDGNHCIDDTGTQIELAGILTGGINGNAERYNVYQRP